MRLQRDERFERERRAWRLRHTCEYCVHWDAETGACAHGWPNDEHREGYYDSKATLVVFCKEFELR